MLEKLNNKQQRNAESRVIYTIVDSLTQFTDECPDKNDRYDLDKYPKAIQLLREIINELDGGNEKTNAFGNVKMMENLIEQAHAKSTWDFETSLGDTIMEKREALY